MHIIGKEEQFAGLVVPSVSGRKHVLLLPHICERFEGCEIFFRLIQEFGSLDKDRVSEHIHILAESELLQF